MLPIIILCGGLGTRVSEYNVAKSMIKIDGFPFIDYQLRLLEKAGFEKVILSIGHKGNTIFNFLNNCSFKYKIDITYVYDGAVALGTGGAVNKCVKELPFLFQNGFFVLYGDSYVDMDYYGMEEEFKETHFLASMAIYKNNDKFDKSNVSYNKKDKTLIYDKSLPTSCEYIDAGVNIFSFEVFSECKGTFDLSLIQRNLSLKKSISPFVIKDRFYTIGTKEGIEEFTNFIHQRK